MDRVRDRPRDPILLHPVNRHRVEIQELQRTFRVQTYVKDWFTSTIRSLEYKMESTSLFLENVLANNNDEFMSLWNRYNNIKNEILQVYDIIKNNDENYNDLLDNHHIAVHNYSRFTTKPADVPSNTWRMLKSRAKALTEICKLEVDVAELGFEVQKMKVIKEQLEIGRSSMLELFCIHLHQLPEEDKERWNNLIMAHRLDLPFIHSDDGTF